MKKRVGISLNIEERVGSLVGSVVGRVEVQPQPVSPRRNGDGICGRGFEDPSGHVRDR